MGIIINKLCCIDSNEILENTNFKYSLSRNEDNNSRGSILGLKNLPDSDINTQNSPKIHIKSLSRLPISTKNVIRQKTGDPFDYYKIIKKLGNGTFGEVYKIMHRKTGNIRAMKIIPKNNTKPGFADKDIIHEITIMKNLDHPHVIKLYEFYIDDSNYYLINEFCSEGDLSEKMYKLKSLPEQIVKILMAQIFNAVLYLNNRGIIHGDLKLENILVDSYLDNNKESEKSNFISSLIQDAKDVRSYLSKKNIRRSASNIFNNFKSSLIKENEKKNENNQNYIKKKFKFKNIEDIKNQRKSLLISLAKLKSANKSEIYNSTEGNIKEEEKEDEKEQNSEDSSFCEESDSINNTPSHKNKPPKNKKNVPLNKSVKFNFESKADKKQKVKILNSSPNINIEKKEIKNYCEYQDIICNTETKTISRKSYNYNRLKIKNFELKLIDFGCSKMFNQYKRTFEDTIGTLVYCSPEVLKNNYNQKCDIWSCGVIMYILLSGKYPFYGNSEEEITRKILTGNYNFEDKHFIDVSENAKDLIKRCLIHDKNKRITVKEALRHEFFTGEININNIFEDEIDTKNILINLKNNSRKISKFYQIVLAFLSYNFADKEELKKLRKIFYKIDLNLDGKLTKEELYLAYREAEIKINKSELEKIIDSIDFDGNGSIEYEEFIRVTLPKEQLFTDVNLKIAFDMFDIDKNGTISMREILEVIGATDLEIDKKVIDQLKKEILTDGDEEINFKHFKEMMLKLK
jgi:serine/threonine protein kinase